MRIAKSPCSKKEGKMPAFSKDGREVVRFSAFDSVKKGLAQ